MAGSKSKFGSGRFIRLFAFVIRLDGSLRARHLLDNGGEGDHLRNLTGISGHVFTIIYIIFMHFVGLTY